MKLILGILSLCTLCTVATARPVPPLDGDITLERGLVVSDTFYPREHPWWFRVHHNGGGEFFSVFTGGRGFSSPPFTPHTVLAFYGPDGILLASSTRPVEQINQIAYGPAWSSGLPGSPTMFPANTFYYVGVGSGGTTFGDGFAFNMGPETGIVRIAISPAPGTAMPLCGIALLALRRRRQK